VTCTRSFNRREEEDGVVTPSHSVDSFAQLEADDGEQK